MKITIMHSLYIVYVGVCVLVILDTRSQAGADDTEECPCDPEHDPVCGSDYITYNNKCEVECLQRMRPELKIIGEEGEPCEHVLYTYTPADLPPHIKLY